MDTLLNQKKSLVYDQLKIITILLVVLGHCFVMFSPDGAIPVLRQSVVLTYLSAMLYSFHIPCFFMVSGAIFGFSLGKGKYNVFSAFVGKKALRLGVPYVFFGVCIVLPTLIFCGLLDGSAWYTFFRNLIIGDQVRHLWYLYDLFLIFVLLWFFRKYFTARYAKAVLAVSFCVSLVFRSMPFSFISYFQIGNTLYYQFFFICGIFLNLYFGQLVDFFRHRRWLLPVCVVLLILSCFLDIFTFTDYLYAFAGIAVSFQCALLSATKKTWIEHKCQRMVAEDSYGIYLFHPMMIYLIFYCFSQKEMPVWILFGIAFIVSFVCSLLLTELCRKGHLGFIIGEGVKKRA